MTNPPTMSATPSTVTVPSTNKNSSMTPLPNPTTKITPKPLLIHNYSKPTINKPSNLENYPKKYKLQLSNRINNLHLKTVSSMMISPKLKKYNTKKPSKLNLPNKSISSQTIHSIKSLPKT